MCYFRFRFSQTGGEPQLCLSIWQFCSKVVESTSPFDAHQYEVICFWNRLHGATRATARLLKLKSSYRRVQGMSIGSSERLYEILWNFNTSQPRESAYYAASVKVDGILRAKTGEETYCYAEPKWPLGLEYDKDPVKRSSYAYYRVFGGKFESSVSNKLKS